MLDSTIISLLKEMKENCLKADFYKDPKRNDKAEALNYAIFIIESMGSRNEQVADKWIKCSDRLPPMKFDGISQHVSEDVFITNGKYIEIGCRETFLSYEDGEGVDNWCWWVRSNCLLNEKDITHWMPLPELPKKCEISCENCKHFYYSEIVQGGSCWGEKNLAKKRNADDKICELFISNK